MAKRKFELTGGSSNKFWHVEQTGKTQIVAYGKIGSQGRTVKKEFKSASEARDACNKLIGQKTKKGYLEVGTKRKLSKKKAKKSTKTTASKSATKATSKAATASAHKKAKATKKAVRAPVKISDKTEPAVRLDAIDPATIIGRNESKSVSKNKQAVHTSILCLTKTHVESYSQSIWRNKNKNGTWQTKPSLESRSRERTKISHIKSVKTKPDGKNRRMLQIVTDGKAISEESYKEGRAAWTNQREKLYCPTFYSDAKTISQCRAIIATALRGCK